jgi:membrane-bound lytic murein transglycosylase F
MRKRFFKKINTSLLFLIILIAPGSFTIKPQLYFLGADDKGGLLANIQQRGKLVAITDNNPLNYFTYRGEQKGYQYDMLKSFADHLGVELELIVEPDPYQALQYLRQNQVDVVAMELPPSAEIRQGVTFTDALFESGQVLVQRKPERWRRMPDMKTAEKLLIRNLAELSGQTIALPSHKQKQFYLSDIQHATANSVNLIAINNVNNVELIEAVNNKEVDYTIAYEHTARAMSQIYPNLDINTSVSPRMGVSWALRNGSVNLQQEINEWIGEHKESRDFAVLYNKYYKNARWARLATGKLVSRSGISEYDDIIRQSTHIINWDWRLIAALIYKESKFQPEAVSHRGAFGLMQLMPKTARHFGADVHSTPAEQIAAGVRLIQYLDKQFIQSVPNPEERIKFILASYNLGQAHILDAQRLAEKYGKNPAIWYDNVEFFMLAKSQPEYFNDPVVKYGRVKGIETEQFVKDVLERYDHFKTLASR